ncbi:hypothetical protein BJX64DRAFT_273284 [Aspergillus heterothallicus]
MSGFFSQASTLHSRLSVGVWLSLFIHLFFTTGCPYLHISIDLPSIYFFTYLLAVDCDCDCDSLFWIPLPIWLHFARLPTYQ